MGLLLDPSIPPREGPIVFDPGQDPIPPGKPIDQAPDVDFAG
jgi:hypothetical protein